MTTCTPRPDERVQVDGQGRYEGLALAGLHLGDPAEVKSHAAHQLNVEVPLAEDPPSSLADRGERLDQQVVERRSVVQALLEHDGRVSELLVGASLHLGLEFVDERDELCEAAYFLALPGLERAREKAHGGPFYRRRMARPIGQRPGPSGRWFVPRVRPSDQLSFQPLHLVLELLHDSVDGRERIRRLRVAHGARDRAL